MKARERSGMLTVRQQRRMQIARQLTASGTPVSQETVRRTLKRGGIGAIQSRSEWGAKERRQMAGAEVRTNKGSADMARMVTWRALVLTPFVPWPHPTSRKVATAGMRALFTTTSHSSLSFRGESQGERGVAGSAGNCKRHFRDRVLFEKRSQRF